MIGISFLICLGLGIFFATERKFAAMVVWFVVAFIPVINVFAAVGGLLYLIVQALKGKS